MTSDHSLTLDFGVGRAAADLATVVCIAPPDSLCHAVWDCGCEEWGDPHIQNGLPVHTITEYDDEDNGDLEVHHVGRFDPEFCNLREWYDGSDEALVGGSVTFDVTAEWTGDGYEFYAMG